MICFCFVTEVNLLKLVLLASLVFKLLLKLFRNIFRRPTTYIQRPAQIFQLLSRYPGRSHWSGQRSAEFLHRSLFLDPSSFGHVWGQVVEEAARGQQTFCTDQAVLSGGCSCLNWHWDPFDLFKYFSSHLRSGHKTLSQFSFNHVELLCFVSFVMLQNRKTIDPRNTS